MAISAPRTCLSIASRRLASRSSARSRVHRSRAALIAAGGAWLALSDGRTATQRGADGVRDLVIFDLAFDYHATTRLAVCRADSCSDAAYGAAVGLLQAAGIAVSPIDDVAGLPVLRTVVMLANEAADAVQQGIASAADIDVAMQKGVNYPRGPLAWADEIGCEYVRDVLVNLMAHYGDARYRVSPLIARRCAAGARLTGVTRRRDAMGEHHPALSPAQAQALAERAAEAMWSNDRASKGMGMRIDAVGPGVATLSMPVRSDMLNGHDICHGGFIFTLADSAFAFACNSYNLVTVASGCSIEFLAPAREGDVLTAHAHERSASGRTGVYDIEVTNQRGEKIALFRGKSYRIKGHVVEVTSDPTSSPRR